eukprot:3904038-Prymnesium_polylepis.1
MQGLTVRQVHMHAHDAARSVSLARTRNGVTTELIAVPQYCGYGECQRFMDLASVDIRRGDSLTFTCVFDNSLSIPIRFGMSHGQEMCGPILLYTPHLAGIHAETMYEVDRAGNSDNRPMARQ